MSRTSKNCVSVCVCVCVCVCSVCIMQRDGERERQREIKRQVCVVCVLCIDRGREGKRFDDEKMKRLNEVDDVLIQTGNGMPRRKCSR